MFRASYFIGLSFLACVGISSIHGDDVHVPFSSSRQLAFAKASTVAKAMADKIADKSTTWLPQDERENKAPTFLVFGGETGWIGQKIVHSLEQRGYRVVATKTRLEHRTHVEQDIEDVQPTCVINAAGITGRPNVDWCEDHQQDTIRANLIGALTLADVTYQRNIHCINLGTGCIYSYDDEHTIANNRGFTEHEQPNFTGSFYSYTKSMLDRLLLLYPNVLNLRLRMPISDDLHARSFITKIIHYDKVVNIPNSMSVLHDLLPLIADMAERRLTGNMNFVNPGTISHNEVLALYRDYINPAFTWKNFTIAEQDKILKAPRSNNCLDTARLSAEFPQVPHIKDAMVGVFQRMQAQQGNAAIS